MYGVKKMKNNFIKKIFFGKFYKCNKYYSQAVCYIACNQARVVIISRKLTESVVHIHKSSLGAMGVELPNFKGICW